MEFIAGAGDWIMIVSGLLTATMVQAVIAPRAALQTMFGGELQGPLAEIVVRNWGALITLIGLMLIYGGWTSSSQGLILTVAAASKIVFLALVLTYGRQFLAKSVSLAVGLDSLSILLFALILAAR